MSTRTLNPGGARDWLRMLVVVVVVLAVAVTGAVWAMDSTAARNRPTVPVSPAVENASGVRILRATLAAAGGLIDVRYVVLNRGKAATSVGVVDDPPVLDNDRNGAALQTVLAMQHRKDLRNGGTYFLIYHNTNMSVRRGDRIDITLAGVTLNNVPVE